MDHTFRPVTNASGLAAINALNKAVYDVIPLDHDRDGDEDLLVAFADDTMSVQLWRNDLGQLASWTSITLEGAGGAGHANRSGIGARIEVTANGITQTREVDAAPGQHAPQAPLTQTLGLGSATMIDRLRVRWPATPVTWTEWQYVPVDTFLRLREVCSLPADPQNLRMAKLSQLQLSWSEPAEVGLSWKVYRDPAPNP
jgi:hypothetical protein